MKIQFLTFVLMIRDLKLYTHLQYMYNGFIQLDIIFDVFKRLSMIKVKTTIIKSTFSLF
jgi:hypothetical protein